MNIIKILKSKEHNSHYVEKYARFIRQCFEYNSLHNKNKQLCCMEIHHICPRASDLFPEYENFKIHNWNKIELTPRQHIIAHLILSKCYPNIRSPIAAIYFMMNKNGYKLNTKEYQLIKELYNSTPRSEEHKKNISKALTGIPLSNERKSNISKSRLGIKVSKEFNDIRSIKMKEKYNSGFKHPMLGETHSKEAKEKISKGLSLYYENNEHYEMTDEIKSKISKSIKKKYASGFTHPMTGRKHTDKAKELNRQKALNRPRIECPHCGKIGPKPNMIQHHFDNCKLRS